MKISTGEPGGHNFLNPNLIKDLVQELKGTIVECNTAYEGRRNTSMAHWHTMEEHGFHGHRALRSSGRGGGHGASGGGQVSICGRTTWEPI